MSQQHAQFEEEFRDNPPSYQSSSADQQPESYIPPLQAYTNISGQKLLAQDFNMGNAPSAGQRLALAIVSLVFVFITFMVTIGIATATIGTPAFMLAVLFALVFTAFVVLINLIFNRKH